MYTRILMALVLGSVLLGSEARADDWSDSPLGKTTFGELWMGPAIKADDLEGSVVVMEFWGIHCPPCIASMPHMSKLSSSGAGKGLVVIGCHAQGPAKDEAIALCTKHGVNYTIFANGNVPGKMTFTGIPHAFVFDHNGQIIFEGQPTSQMDSVIQKALAARPNPLLGDMKYVKLSSAASMVKAGRLGEALKECQKNKDKDADASKEAAYLTARLERHIKKLQDKADGDRELAPAAVMEGLTALKQQLDGTEVAVKAAETLKTLAADKDFQKSLAAEKEYKVIAGALGKIGSPNAAERDAWARRNDQALKQIAARIETMKKTYPANKLAARIEEEFKAVQGK